MLKYALANVDISMTDIGREFKNNAVGVNHFEEDFIRDLKENPL